MTLAFVYGTRPEAIKIGPVVRALRDRGVRPLLIATGQHWDLLDGTPADSDLADSISLGLRATSDLEGWMEGAVPCIAAVLRAEQASGVVVQGDTASVLAGARAAHGMGLPIAHIEAGVRSGSLKEPYPEEAIRRWVTQLVEETTGLHCAPTTIAKGHLVKERVPAARILVTGNPIVSAMALYAGAEPVAEPDPRVLVTMHRREWLARGERHVRQTIQAIGPIAEAHPAVSFVWPMHPVVRSVVDPGAIPLPPNVLVGDPVPYPRSVRLVAGSIGVATDSGGLQEEACTLGVPCAVLRNVTDRPESVLWGTATLFPPSPEGMTRGLEALLARRMPRTPSDLYGTVESAARIADALLAWALPAPTAPIVAPYPRTTPSYFVPKS